MSVYRDKLLADIERKELQLWLFGVVREQVRTLQGKPVSRRLKTAVEKRILELKGSGAGFRVYYANEYGSYRISFWRDVKPVDYNDREQMTICFEGSNRAELKNKTIDEEQFVLLNNGYALNAERLPKLRMALDKLEAWEARKAEIDAQSKALVAEMGEFECKYLFGE